MRVGAHLGLAEPAQRQAHARQRRARHERQGVGLVLGLVRGAEQAPAVVGALDPRVVPGGDSVAAAPRLQRLEQQAELEVPVAVRARVGRAARGVLVEERLHHAVAEALRGVEHEVREAQAPRHRGGLLDGAERARRERAVAGRSRSRPHRRRVTPVTSCPASTSSAAATLESTPPLMATSTPGPALTAGPPPPTRARPAPPRRSAATAASTSSPVVVRRRREAQRAHRQLARHAHGRQHRRGLDPAAGAGRPGRRPPRPAPPAHAAAGRCARPGTRRTPCWAAAAPPPRARPGRARPRAGRPRGARAAPAASPPKASSSRAASSAARPSPTMPGTFSVPPRRPPSWPVPRKSGSKGATPAHDQRAGALGAAELVPRDDQVVGVQLAGVHRDLARRLHRVAQDQHAARARAPRQLGHRLEHAGLVVGEHHGQHRGPRGRGRPRPVGRHAPVRVHRQVGRRRSRRAPAPPPRRARRGARSPRWPRRGRAPRAPTPRR